MKFETRLTEDEAKAVKKMIDDQGVPAVAKKFQVHPATLTRLVGCLTVRRGTLHLVRAALGAP